MKLNDVLNTVISVKTTYVVKVDIKLNGIIEFIQYLFFRF